MFQALPVSSGKGSATSSSSPFAYVTMKALLLDHTTHYVHTPLAVWFNEATSFAEVAKISIINFDFYAF
jgi:hypothetical protein